MNQSESINELATALAKAQGEFLKPKKDKLNPHFKSQYSSLAEIIECTSPALVKHGICTLQCPRVEESGFVVIETMLAHSSGQFIKTELFMRPDRSNIQGIGSAITYARRYALGAVLNVSAGDDDDGNAAMPEKRANKPAPLAENKAAPTPKPLDLNQKFNKDLEEHKRALMVLLKKHKVPNEQMKNYFEFISIDDGILLKDLEKKILTMMEQG